MSCSYADIAMARYSLASKFNLRPRVCKRFGNNMFVLWEHGIASLLLFLRYLNSIDKTDKINFSVEIVSNANFGFFYWKLKIVESNIRVDIFAKPTSSFIYTTPTFCYPKKNISNIGKDISLSLRRICDNNDVIFDKRFLEYQNYLIAREHKPSKVIQELKLEQNKKNRIR